MECTPVEGPILAVDDEQRLLDTMAFTLRRWGHSMMGAGNAVTALAMLKASLSAGRGTGFPRGRC